MRTPPAPTPLPPPQTQAEAEARYHAGQVNAWVAIIQVVMDAGASERRDGDPEREAEAA